MPDSLPNPVLERFVERVGGLYSLPQVAVQVLELMGTPQVDVRAVKECLQNDPALVAKILRVVNSSLFGLSHHVSDLNQALTLLGTRPLKLLVLGFSLPKELWSGLETDVLARYWRRTLVKAVAAREISERIWLTPGDEAFLAGLLQDIGMLALIQDLGPRYTKAIDRVLERGGDLAATEIASLGFEHTQLSARLLAHWRLPDALVAAVEARRCVERLSAPSHRERPLPQMLHLAELVAAFLVDNRPAALAELMDAGRAYRDVALEQLTAVLESLDTKVAELADVLSLDLPAGQTYADIVAKAQGQLAGVIADLATHPQREQQAPARGEELWLVAQAREPAGWQPGRGKSVTGAAPLAAVVSSTPPRAVSRAADPGLVGSVSAGIAGCRAAHASFSLLLVELDRYDELILTHGPARAVQLVSLLEAALRTACDPADMRLPQGDGSYAVLLEARDRVQAAALGRDVMQRFSALLVRRSSGGLAGVTLSAGLATLTLPPKNFPVQMLLDAAQRCLSAAQRCGGDSLKSIEL